MSEPRQHAYIATLTQQLTEGQIDRRDFLRTATLLGMSATAAYACVSKITGQHFATPAKADTPKGGAVRISMRVQEVTSPHTYNWIHASNVGRQVHEYLTKTGQDNLTRPYLAESWIASDDLKTWTLNLRKVKWHNGRDFTADDALWNLSRVLAEATKSSVFGLMKGYMLNETVDGKFELWDANALEKVDDHTIRLNLKLPQVAVPEHLFHYPLAMLDPEEGGAFGVGSNGTGPFELVEHEVGKKSVLKARKDYWGEGPHVDTLEFVDLGDDPADAIDALASKQIHGAYTIEVVQLDALRLVPHLQLYEAPTADTAVMRGKVTIKPFDDPRVRKALRLAIDSKKTQQITLGALGLPAEHHHVCPIHPEYAELPFMEQNVEAAKSLLAEAGYPDGIDLGMIDCRAAPGWEFNTVQAMIEQWKEVGIRFEINLMPSNEFWDVWDKAPFGFTPWGHRPLGILILGLAYRSGVPWNESEYSNPEFDRLLTEAEGTLDVDKRREVMARIEKIMQDDGPIVQPIWRSVMTVMDKRVKGFKMHPTRYIFGNELALDS